MIFSLFCLSTYSQVSKQELFDTVWKYEIDSLALPTNDANYWSNLDRRGKVVEMNGITDETGKEKVRDLISRWGILELVDLFKTDEAWDHKGYDPMLYIVRVTIRGGKIVAVNGLTLREYHGRSKVAYLNKHLFL